MPLYEYKCHSCGKTFEALQKFSDAPLTTHEECGGQLEQLLSAPAFHLKGTGWYATDYAKGSAPGPAKPADGKPGDSKSDSGGDAKSGDSKSKDSGSSESKPAATETKSTDTKPATVSTADSK